MIRLLVEVRGTVQGVGFRYATKAEAERLRLVGSVRNRDDGSVEVVMEGADADVRAMLAWLAHGPRGAIVRSVDATDDEPRGDRGFHIAD
ncbi:acylphosphatase [Luethyella okanaganae]|uniref:acylphosphatase n=1 Tax=Luethyella okanaganae TaxID=69372 RepID=A0ABW1VLF5_9MICO